jgi:small subunit ribosomal protein S7
MRKRRASLRPRVPDPKFGDTLVSQFVNSLMLDGKKAVAQRIMYDAFDIMAEKSGQPGVEVFRKAVGNAAPMIEVRSRRVGGATYQVPTEVRPERRTALANGEGATVKKRDDTHRMAEANKAFAHFRF